MMVPFSRLQEGIRTVSRSQLQDVGVAMVVQGQEVIAASIFNMVRKRVRSDVVTMQIMLFAVKRDFQNQGVARRLLWALFKLCNREGFQTDKLMVLSANRPESTQNWWTVKGGFSTDEGDDLANEGSYTTYDAFERFFTGGSVPDAFLLPWPMYPDVQNEAHAEGQARRRAVHEKQLAAREDEVTAEMLARCGFNEITVLVCPVSSWLASHGEQWVRGRGHQVEEQQAAAAADDGPGDGLTDAAMPTVGGNEDGEAEGGEEDVDGEMPVAGDEGGVDDDMVIDVDRDETNRADPPAVPPRQPSTADAVGDEGEDVAAAAANTQARRWAGKPKADPEIRKLRIGEFMMGSGRLSKVFHNDGADVYAMEHDPKKPEYGDGLVRPSERPTVGEVARQMRSASPSAPSAPPQLYLDLSACRSMRPRDLPTLDYAHFSPTCKSVSKCAGDAHKRTVDNGFLGPDGDKICIEYNMDLTWIRQVIEDQLLRPGNEGFVYTIEAPEGIAHEVPHLKFLEIPRTHGGVGAERVRIDFCKFGQEHQKPTQLWTNIESMIDELKDEHKNPYLCCHFPCKHGRGYHPKLGREGIAVAEAEPFPMELVYWMKTHVKKSIGHRVKDKVKA